MWISLYLLFALANAAEKRFLIISQPYIATISFVTVDDQGNSSAPKVLINNGLKNPLGIAVDAVHNLLYVSDIEVRKIYRYHLLFNHGGLVTTGGRFVAASDVEARWLSVDEVGNLFFTEEAAQAVKKVKPYDPAVANPVTPTIEFTSDSSDNVSSPGGIAVNLRDLFWTNKVMGKSKGVVVHVENVTPGLLSSLATPKKIANNIDGAYGICVSPNHVFYTSQTSSVYVVDKVGGKVSIATSQLSSPRGCTWDGSATIFIADKSGNAIMSFPVSHSVAPVEAIKFLEIEGPFDVAMITGGTHLHKTRFLLFMLFSII